MEGYLSEIRFFAGNFNPRSWMFCQGQILSIAQNTALFSLIGTIYGGNGQTTFALPDLRSRVAVGAGQGPGLPGITQGEMAGSQSVTLTAANVPAHNHAFTGTVTSPATGTAGNSDTPATNIFAAHAAKENYAGATTGNGSMAPAPVAGNTGIAGSGQPFDQRQAYLGLNYIICVEGIYPSRN